MTPDQQSRLLELFAALSQETLTAAEHQELQAVLHADVEARRLWFLHQDLELGLKSLTQILEGTSGPPMEGARSARDGQGTGIHLLTGIADASRASRLARRNPTRTAIALLCLSAMVMFGGYILRRPPDSDHTVGSKLANHRADDFIVESPTHGTKFAISDHKGQVIALHFLLKTECPFCLKLAHDYSQLAASHPDVLHLFLKPDSSDEIKIWAGKISQEGLKNPPVIYRDPDARLAKDFGIPDGYEFHGQTGHYPALVLLDTTGKERFRYVGKSNADRMTPDDFIARLAMVTDRN